MCERKLLIDDVYLGLHWFNYYDFINENNSV